MSNSIIAGHHAAGTLAHEGALASQNQQMQGGQGPQGGQMQLTEGDLRVATDLKVVEHSPTRAEKAHGLSMAVRDSLAQLAPQARELYSLSLIRAAEGSPQAPSEPALERAVAQIQRGQKGPQPGQLTVAFLKVLYQGALEAGATNASRVQTSIAGASSTAGAAAATMPMMESPTVASTVPVAGINAINAQQQQQAQAKKKNDQQQ